MLRPSCRTSRASDGQKQTRRVRSAAAPPPGTRPRHDVSSLPPGAALTLLADRVVRRPRPRVGWIPVAGISGDALVENAVRPDEDVARRPVGVGAGAVHRSGAGAARVSETRVERLEKRDRIVEGDLSDDGIADALVALDRGELVAPFDHRVRGAPLLDLIGVNDERGAVPERDRLTLPLRELLALRQMVPSVGMRPANLVRDEHVADDHDLRRADDELLRALHAADEAIREAERRRPPVTSLGLRFHLLHVILAILRGQRRGNGARLDVAPVEPAGAASELAIPIRQGRQRVSGPAAGLLQPRLVMLPGGLERVRASDGVLVSLGTLRAKPVV